MVATTITETSASHARKRLRAREDAVEASEKESLRENSNGASEIAVVQPACSSMIQEVKEQLINLYAPSAEAKIWSVAARGLRRPSPPTIFPEYTKPGGVEYIYRDLDFWTSGFFPGSLHLLLSRRRMYGHLSGCSKDTLHRVPHLLNLE
jgi:hypothetical protein